LQDSRPLLHFQKYGGLQSDVTRKNIATTNEGSKLRFAPKNLNTNIVFFISSPYLLFKLTNQSVPIFEYGWIDFAVLLFVSFILFFLNKIIRYIIFNEPNWFCKTYLGSIESRRVFTN